jgi:serine/threonine protein kinase
MAMLCSPSTSDVLVGGRYQVQDKSVGQGVYGVVYKAEDVKTREAVALKKIRRDYNNEGIPRTELREISLLHELRHPNIVLLKNCLYEDNRWFLVFEFVDTDLRKYITSTEGPLDPKLVKSLMHQLCSGLSYCHSRGIMHRDLKPANLLVSKSGVLKIADFGLGRSFTPPIRVLTHEVVTLWYRAPEILLGSQAYSPSVDVWGVGCIFAELVMKSPLFPGTSEVDELRMIFSLLGTPNDDVWPDVTKLPEWKSDFPAWPRRSLHNKVHGLDEHGIDLLQSFLAYSPVHRISAKKALERSYFL